MWMTCMSVVVSVLVLVASWRGHVMQHFDGVL